jgi:hypothetical protein
VLPTVWIRLINFEFQPEFYYSGPSLALKVSEEGVAGGSRQGDGTPGKRRRARSSPRWFGRTLIDTKTMVECHEKEREKREREERLNHSLRSFSQLPKAKKRGIFSVSDLKPPLLRFFFTFLLFSWVECISPKIFIAPFK